MNVSVKDFSVTMDVKNNGIELDVYDNDQHLGDLVVRKSGLEWCQGKTRKKNGKKISWKDFIKHMQSH
jgi:hypothetical protein